MLKQPNERGERLISFEYFKVCLYKLPIFSIIDVILVIYMQQQIFSYGFEQIKI